DQQVKIRGFRIELGEIENRLLKHEHIKDAVVLAREAPSRDTDLWAYFVSAEGISLSITEIREFLSVNLPGYMIPAYYVDIEKIPFTCHGKLDKKALDKYSVNLQTGVEYVDPASDMEKIVAGTWKEVLGIDKVGINDNFFEIGGNSLKIISLSNKLKEVLDRDIPVVILFRYTSVSTFARYLDMEETKSNLNEQDRSDVIQRGKRDKMKRLKMRKGVKR
ncbi:MAG: non-ribosomal peptide synthetase, partial [Candidatus Aminicenantes bacterium]|nr:non-ribosomal peptide synthetase [Candidatus Aminicenantes bacterium]